METRPFRLVDLPAICPCITQEYSQLLVQAAVYQIAMHGYTTGDTLTISGDFTAQFDLVLPYEVTGAMRRTWTERPDTINRAACAVALYAMHALTAFTVISKSYIGTGFDYWLAPKETPCDTDLPFRQAVRLEVSGIDRGTDAEIKRRIAEKLHQTRRSDAMIIPAYVCVVEFSRLLVTIERK